MKSINYFQAMQMRHFGEINGGISETIPGQAVSAPELLRRYATGQPLGFKNVTPVYDDENSDTIPEFYKLSKLDRLHMIQENNERVQQAKEQLRYYQRSEQQQQQINEQQQAEEERLTKKSDPLQSEKMEA